MVGGITSGIYSTRFQQGYVFKMELRSVIQVSLDQERGMLGVLLM